MPSAARAYCRASDEVGEDGRCVPEPNAPYLFWARSCVAYSFNERVFGQLDELNEREIRAAFADAFAAWAAVDCDGRRPFFVEQLAHTTSTSKSELLRDEHNEMVVLALDSRQWRALADHSSAAIALTLMWHNKQTGEILDTDMELNLGVGTFNDCVKRHCGPSMLDLQNAITHEAGHVLGLGHSTDPKSTMTPQARGRADTEKRSLEADDKAGYCALELPEWQCAGTSCACPPPPIVDAESGLVTTDTASCQALHGATKMARWVWPAYGLFLCLCGYRARRRVQRGSGSPTKP